MNEPIYLRIKNLAKRKKLDYEEISEALNTTKKTVFNHLNGKTKIDLELFVQYCKVLDVSPVMFFTDDDFEGINKENEELHATVEKLKFLVNSMRIALIGCDPKYAREVDEMLEEVKDW